MVEKPPTGEGMKWWRWRKKGGGKRTKKGGEIMDEEEVKRTDKEAG